MRMLTLDTQTKLPKLNEVQWAEPVFENSEVEPIQYTGEDLITVNAARVSFKKRSFELNDRDKRLIKYLGEHKHEMPFAHSHASFHIKAPIFVARQLFKHKVGFTESEVSRRYVDDLPTFYKIKEFRERIKDKKQGSGDKLDGKTNLGCLVSYEVFCRNALHHYQLLLDNGVAPEQARMVLPVCTMTEWIWTGSLLGFARVAKLRLSNDAQLETKEVVQIIADECHKIWPYSWEALTT